MPSIINGLFSGRSGLSSHGLAIAVIGDNISNASTIGYKASRSEFEDLIAGGQTAGKTVGSGSSLSRVSNVFEQGTLEFTGRSLDLAVDGSGYFVIDDNGARSFTRAGNFRVDDEGFVVTQRGDQVLGFPAQGTGALSAININSISQDSIATNTVTISGNLNAGEAAATGTIPPANPTYAQLESSSQFSTVFTVFDSLGESHEANAYFFKESANSWTAAIYADGADITGGTAGTPSFIGSNTNLDFTAGGLRTTIPTTPDITASFAWNSGASTSSIGVTFDPFTQFSTSSNIQSIVGDGSGVGNITSLSIDRDGDIFALLDNGQASVIGTVGVANFTNPEGLVRVGGNFVQESGESGSPIFGTPNTGTFGAVEAGSVELSTVDIASEFVKLITVQRAFQANSRIITSINSLLAEIIQLV